MGMTGFMVKMVILMDLMVMKVVLMVIMFGWLYNGWLVIMVATSSSSAVSRPPAW